MKQLVPPILIVLAGVAWLLEALDVLPGVDWLWTVGLAAAGGGTFALCGLNRLTAVAGPFLWTASIFSLLRQTGHITLRKELPLLLIALGLFWLAACLLRLPAPATLACDAAQDP
jgi:hypothetical protein